MSYELSSNLRLSILGNWKILEKRKKRTKIGLSDQSFFLEIKFFVITAKNYAVVKVFCSCPVVLAFFTLFQMFCPGLIVCGNKFLFITCPSFIQTSVFWSFLKLQIFNANIKSDSVRKYTKLTVFFKNSFSWLM